MQLSEFLPYFSFRGRGSQAEQDSTNQLLPPGAAFRDGVLAFPVDDQNSPAFIKNFKRDSWFYFNWNNQYARSLEWTRRLFCDELSEVTGLTVELACGTGGGNLPGLMRRNPEQRMIVQDSSYSLLLLWKRLVENRGSGKNVLFSCFDPTLDVLSANSISAISGVYALSEARMSARILAQAYRVLQPGGVLYLGEPLLDEAGWSGLPDTVQAKWLAEMHGLTEGYSPQIESAGFTIAVEEREPKREIDPKEFLLSREAAALGVALSFESQWIKAYKGK